MSGSTPGGYDPVELRRTIAICFSVGELRALAESLGVGGIAWERGISEAAREVIRQSERYSGLPALVAKLREMKPLVEWPEPAAPLPVPAAQAIPPTRVDDGIDALPVQSAPAIPIVGPPTLAASPGTLGPPGPPAGPGTLVSAAPGPVLNDPYAPSANVAVTPHVAPPLGAAPAASVPPRSTAGWPGTTPEPAPPASRGLDPRILVAVAGMTVAAAIIAYVAGRASSGPAASASATPTSQAAPGRTDGPAGMAAVTLARSYANLARVCELPASAGNNELVFRRVFERCGPVTAPRYSSATPTTATTPTASADPGDAPAPDRTARPGRGRGDAPSGAPPAARGCMGTCDAQHAACRGRCGPEPTESGAYDGYTRCQGRCLSDASRCRLSCH